jgi:hypothetical protein
MKVLLGVPIFWLLGESACAATGNSAAADEAAVWRAVAAHVAQSERQAGGGIGTLSVLNVSSFPTMPYIHEQIDQGAEKGLCGLTSLESSEMLAHLRRQNTETVQLDGFLSALPEVVLTSSRPPEGDYLGMSRVVFIANRQTAFLDLDISGLSGVIVRVDKVGAAWVPGGECVEWVSWR